MNHGRCEDAHSFVLIDLAGEGADCISSPFLFTQHLPGRVLELLSTAFKSEKVVICSFLHPTWKSRAAN